MNRNRIMLVIGIALLLAVLASIGAYKFLSGRTAEEKAHYDWMGYTANWIAVAPRGTRQDCACSSLQV